MPCTNLIQISNSPTQTCVIARCNWVPGHPPHFTSASTSVLPRRGAVRRRRRNQSRAFWRGPHPGCQSGCGPPSAHRDGNDLTEAFRRSAPFPPAGAGLMRLVPLLCATKLTRWGSPVQRPHFAATARVGRPPVASSPLPDWPVTKNRLPQAPLSRSAPSSSS